MNPVSRRDFVAAGLAALGSGGLVLSAQAQETPSAGDLGAYGRFLARASGRAPRQAPGAPEKVFQATEDCILGPFYRKGAPFRGKVTPPLEPGIVMVISGRVWGLDSRKPLVGAQLDVWQANAKGRYDNDDENNPPRPDVFVNRARLITDENGYYEFETVHPGAYQIGANAWRPSHIHYLVGARGYKTLVTQLFFKGDPHNKTDQFIKESLIIDLASKKVGAVAYEAGVFDIVLAPNR
jgi:protocatechuate 3,4-dioxygenase beta subunit